VALRPRLSAGLPKISNFNMPNMARRNKRNESRIRNTTGSCLSNQTDSVKDLLSKLTPNLKRVTEQVHRQDFWRDWLDTHLPAEITGKLTGIVERDGTLVIFAESPAWSARLRFAVQEIEAQIRAAKPGITAVSVRVLPRGAREILTGR
jgi:Dna[CI] antecedent, DciA